MSRTPHSRGWSKVSMLDAALARIVSLCPGTSYSGAGLDGLHQAGILLDPA